MYSSSILLFLGQGACNLSYALVSKSPTQTKKEERARDGDQLQRSHMGKGSAIQPSSVDRDIWKVVTLCTLPSSSVGRDNSGSSNLGNHMCYIIYISGSWHRLPRTPAVSSCEDRAEDMMRLKVENPHLSCRPTIQPRLGASGI